MNTDASTAISDRLVSTRYQLAEQLDGQNRSLVTFDRTQSPDYEGVKWAVRDPYGRVLTKDQKWHDEPMPSNRDAEFYALCRFDSLDQALAAYDLQLATNYPRST